jgi:hypothetical protein
MSKQETIQLYLNERKKSLEHLNENLKQAEIELNKASFEEDMYYNLKSKRHYKEKFNTLHEQSVLHEKDLEKKKKDIEEEINLLTIEIEYIENKLSK